MNVSRNILVTVLLLCVAVSAQTPDEYQVTLSLPEATWALELDLTGFSVDQHDFKPQEGERYVVATLPEQDLRLIAHLFPGGEPVGPVWHRDKHLEELRKHDSARVDITTSESPGSARLEYTSITRPFGDTVITRHIFEFMTRRSILIRVTVSKQHFESADTALMESVLARVHINDKFRPTAFDYFVYANNYLDNANYDAAIRFYWKARREPADDSAFTEQNRLMLLNNLGLAYAYKNDHDSARHIFGIGLLEFADHPIFYYNLACEHAEQKRLDSALINLAAAFEHRDLMLPGDTLPDPLVDTSFSNYHQNKRFLQLVDKYRPTFDKP